MKNKDKQRIFCLISIEEGGIHALFCRLGFHVWDEEGNNYPIYCMYCPKKKNEQKRY